MRKNNFIKKALFCVLCTLALNSKADTNGGSYQVITSTDDFSNDDVIIIVAYDESKNMFAMGTYNDDNAFHAINIGTTTAEYLPEIISINDVNSNGNAYEYRVTTSSNDIILRDGDNYVSSDKNSSSLKLSASSCKWTPQILNNSNFPYEAVCLGLKGDVRYITYSPTYKFKDYVNSPSSSEYIMRGYCYKKISSTFSLTFNKTGYATMYYENNDVELAEGMKAFTLSLVSDGGVYKLRFNDIGTTVPHGTAVMIKGTPNTEYHPTLYSVAATTANGLTPLNDDNVLYGTEAEELQSNGDGRYYKLANDPTKGMRFYWGAPNGAAFTNLAHKAYLFIPASSPASLDSEFLFIDDATAIGRISEYDNTDNAKKIYDITGRAQGNSHSNAINIVNNKKFIK